jgi:RNA polymerase sigma-70 factor (ECF subfamily)
MSPGPVLSLSGRRRRRAAGERLSELFEQHGRMVYGICRLILRDPTEAEDAAQQTFLSAYRGLLAGQEPREPSAWLGTIARNECRGRLRRRSTEPLALVSEPYGDETQREVSRHAEIEALSAALAELPAQQRDAIVLREFYGLSYAEVASALGVSGPAVESLIFRSRRRLQVELKPLRAALGALIIPPSLRDSLEQALPGFGGGAGTGVGAAALAKLGTTSVAAKLAAGTLVLGSLGTVAGLEAHPHARTPQRPRHSARQAAPARQGLLELHAPAAAPHFVVETSGSVHETGHRGRKGEDASGASGGETRRTETETETESKPSGTTTEGEHHDGGGAETESGGTGTTTTTGSGGEHGDGGGEHHHGGSGGGSDGGGGSSGD